MRRQVLLLLLPLLAAGCARSIPAAQVACTSEEPAVVAAAASASLPIRRWGGGTLVDADGAPFVATFPEGFSSGEAVESWPGAAAIAGAPPAFRRLAGRSFVYDDALLALERTARGDAAGAAQVLATLAALQLGDGAWGFAFSLDEPFYDAGYVRAGTVAFAVYAFARYAERFGDHRFRAYAGRGADWLLAQRDPATGLVRAGRGRWLDRGATFEAGYRADFFATEHQIDAFFALAALGRVDPGGPWAAGAAALERAILDRLWDDEAGRFLQGRGADGSPDPTSALDAAGAWGALFHLASGRRVEALRALDHVERHHRRGDRLLPRIGPDGAGPDTHFVEGAIGRALAWQRIDPARGAAALEAIASFACATGLPLLYADRWEEDFPRAPAAAPTLWFLLASREIAEGAPPFLWTSAGP